MKYIYMNKKDSIAVSDRHIEICTMKGAVSELNEIIKRAEAAEADNASLRGTLRDEILRAEAAEARVAQLEAERDAFAAENDAIHLAVNEMCGTDTSTIEAVQHVIEQRDKLARQLEQAQQQIAELTKKARHVWLDEALNEGDGVYRP